MNLLKIVFTVVVLTGCSTYPRERIEIVHDYIFENGQKTCATHQGFHYVVSRTVIQSEGDNKDYPCYSEIKFRCQDGSLHSFDDGVGYCFISEAQLDETNRNIQNPD
jgi:hypothetical protein